MRPTTRQALFLLMASTTPMLGARAASSQPAVTAPALTPPEVTKFVEAARPGDAGAGGAIVDLDLTVGTDGTLTDATVVSSGGESFDRAALEAVRKFSFSPARRGDKPVPARIRYRYVFEPLPLAPLVPEAPAPGAPSAAPAGATAAAPAPAAPARGRLDGKVLARANGQAVPGAEVSLLPPQGEGPAAGAAPAEIQHAFTVEDGGFQFDDVTPGRYRLHVEAAGLVPVDQAEVVAAGEATTVIYRLDASRAARGDEFGATASIEAPAREVVKRTLKTEELTRAAGTRGDALRAIELMPGVARPPGLSGFIIVRGASPFDSEVVVDGAPVGRLYHFGGLTSFTHSRLLERIDLYPGNFSTRYGRKMGGIIDVGIRDPRTDGFHGIADVNVIDSSLLVEGPVGKRGAFALAAKRSYIDFWFESVVPKDAMQITASPVYYDYQAIYTYRPENGDRLKVMSYGSADVFRLTQANPAEGDPSFTGNVGQETSFHRVQVGWRHNYAPGVEHEMSITGGWLRNKLDIGALGVNFQGPEAYGRAEWRAQLAQRLRLMGGLDVHALQVDVVYNGPPATQFEGNPAINGPLSAQGNSVFNGVFRAFRPAAYLEAMLQPFERLTLVAGARADYFSDVTAWSVDPRLTARLQVAQRTVLKAGAGLFSQPPDYGEAVPGVGNPALGLSHAQHYSAGVEQGFGERVSLGVESFYKRLTDLEVNATDGMPWQVNQGVGRIYGLEVLAKVQPTGKAFGFVSYTLSRSERNDHGQTWRLFDYDQTHILTTAAGYRLGRGWDVGGTFRLTTGSPKTPVVGSIYDANRDFYSPVYGAVNTGRDPLFHRLDVRIEKTWKMRAWQLATYLDLQNVYNHRSQEGVRYSYDYSRSQAVPGLPVIPSLGLRGEM